MHEGSCSPLLLSFQNLKAELEGMYAMTHNIILGVCLTCLPLVVAAESMSVIYNHTVTTANSGDSGGGNVSVSNTTVVNDEVFEHTYATSTDASQAVYVEHEVVASDNHEPTVRTEVHFDAEPNPSFIFSTGTVEDAAKVSSSSKNSESVSASSSQPVDTHTTLEQLQQIISRLLSYVFITLQ